MNDEMWVIGATGRTGKAIATRLHAAHVPLVLLRRKRERLAPSNCTGDLLRVLPRTAGSVASLTVRIRARHVSTTSAFGTPTANEVRRAVAPAQGCYAAATPVTGPPARIVGKDRGDLRAALDLRQRGVCAQKTVVSL